MEKLREAFYDWYEQYVHDKCDVPQKDEIFLWFLKNNE